MFFGMVCPDAFFCRGFFMFTRSQHIYDLLYRAMGKDYQAEVDDLRSIFIANGLDPDSAERSLRMLDVACGTGMHLELFTEFDRVGLDLDPGMLDVARSRCPEVPLFERDMVELDPKELGAPFDVVACLYAAIAYLPGEEELRRAIGGMVDCLGGGGVLLIEPFIEVEDYRPDHLHVIQAEEGGVKVVRMSETRLEGQRFTIDFHYLQGEGGKVRHFTETHVTTLFSRAQIMSAMEDAGLVDVHRKDDFSPRGLLVGRRG